MLVDLWGNPAHPSWRLEDGRWRAGTMYAPYLRIIHRKEDGTYTWHWRENVARLNDMVLNISCFLYATEDEAHEGSRRGGTAFNFLVEFEAAPDSMMVYIVTAAHNLDEGFRTVRMNKRGGGVIIKEIPAENWFRHKDGADVAAACLLGDPGSLPDFLYWPLGLSLTPERCAREDIGIGDPVYMVGRLLSLEGNIVNTPVVKFGNISMMPTEPVPFPYGAGPDQESFIVEMRSVGGFSGAPVFVYKDDEPFAQTTRLLGLTWCHFRESGIENAGMAGVIPAWKIIELMYQEDVVKHRTEKEKEDFKLAEAGGAPYVALDSGDDDRPGPEPERLKVDGSLEEVVERVMDAGKPEDDDHEG